MTAAEWDELARLAQAAQSATRGLPWVKDPDEPDKVLASKNNGWDGSIVATVASDDYGLVEEEVTEFIAAANPATILRLIGEVRRLTDERAEWHEQWDAVRVDLRERYSLAAKVARVEALLRTPDGTPHGDKYQITARTLRAALSAAPTDTTKETP